MVDLWQLLPNENRTAQHKIPVFQGIRKTNVDFHAEPANF